MPSRLLTIGAYGYNEASFLGALKAAGVDVLVDVRMRRGMRGSRYAWANAGRLQSSLGSRGVGYAHWKHLAPTAQIRDWQQARDAAAGTAKRNRSRLDPGFVEMYRAAILDQLDPVNTLIELGDLGQAPALFCVEGFPAACHRSVIVDWLRAATPVTVEDLTP